VNYLFSRL